MSDATSDDGRCCSGISDYGSESALDSATAASRPTASKHDELSTSSDLGDELSPNEEDEEHDTIGQLPSSELTTTHRFALDRHMQFHLNENETTSDDGGTSLSSSSSDADSVSGVLAAGATPIISGKTGSVRGIRGRVRSGIANIVDTQQKARLSKVT